MTSLRLGSRWWIAGEKLAQAFETAMEQTRNSSGGLVELAGDLRQRQALQVVENDRLALRFGQACQGIGHGEQLLGPNRLLARRGLGRSQPAVHARERIADLLVE